MSRGLASEDRFVLALLTSAMAVAVTLIFWLSRGTTFWIDELTWLLQSPHLTVSDALQPHEGHLMLTSHLTYKAVFEIFGANYLPLRLLSVAAVLTTVFLLFTYVRRRVGPLVALAPSLVLLFFGSDSLHVLVGNGFTVLLAVSCGLGALLLLDRDTGWCQVFACVLLCLGAVTYTVALAFIAGIAILILQRTDRWRHLWIVAIPLGLYTAWWFWSLGNADVGPDSHVVLSNILLVPVWGFQSLSAVLEALFGLNYQFGGPANGTSQAGAVLAVLGLIGIWWRMMRGSVPPALWAALAVAVTLWVFGSVSANEFRFPDSSRYLYPGAVAIVLIGAEAISGLMWSRKALIGLFAITAVGMATNLVLLRDQAAKLRNAYAVQVHAAFGALDLAGGEARPNFDPPSLGDQSIIPGGQSPLAFPFGILAAAGESPTEAYLVAADHYGALGYSTLQISAQDEAVRAQVDAVLAGALGLRLAPTMGLAHHCRGVRSRSEGEVAIRLPKHGAILSASSRGGPIGVRRFAEATLVPLGDLAPQSAAILRIPPDGSPRSWWLHVPSSSIVLCAIK